MAIHEYFPEEYLALNQEVSHHPELQRLLANHPSDEFEVKIAEIAAYCDVVLDGTYSQADLRKLCDILNTKLRAKRAMIIV